jgi:UDP-glucose 4-epimerase
MKCVVIGGGGFLGSHLAEALLNLHHKVVVLDRPKTPYLDELAKQGASIAAGDFLDPEFIKETLIDVEVVYHFASTTVPKTSNENPIYDIETNLKGAINLFNAAKDAGVKKVVYSSSGGTVYGVPKEIPINEDHSTSPICSYGIVKLAVEKYLHWFWTLYGLDYCILRMSNVYGDRQPANGVQGIIPTIIDKGLRNQEINIWGDGTIIRDYIHVSDVVTAFLKASTHQGQESIFNISSGQGHSIIEIINMIEALLKQPLQIVHTPGVASDVLVNILDNSRAKVYLNWTPQMNFGDGISRTFQYMRDHPKN